VLPQLVAPDPVSKIFSLVGSGFATSVKRICDPFHVFTAQATVAPSGEIAAELGVFVFPKASINDPIRASFGGAARVWADPSQAGPKVNTTAVAEKTNVKERLQTSVKVMRKA
jgi:hypothetical protein